MYENGIKIIILENKFFFIRSGLLSSHNDAETIGGVGVVGFNTGIGGSSFSSNSEHSESSVVR